MALLWGELGKAVDSLFRLLVAARDQGGATSPIGAISIADCCETGCSRQLRDASHWDSFSNAFVYWVDRIAALAA